MSPPDRTLASERPPYYVFLDKRRGRHACTPLRPGTAAHLVRARPRALRFDSMPDLHSTSSTATNGLPITRSKSNQLNQGESSPIKVKKSEKPALSRSLKMVGPTPHPGPPWTLDIQHSTPNIQVRFFEVGC